MRLMGGGQGRTHRAAVDDDGSLRLALGPGDERLPWLEGDEEDEEPEFDRGRIMAAALVLLLFLAVLVGIAWWLWAGRGAQELAADGSTIEAPDGPYKVRPRKPGGREVLGTGGTSFAVAEGVRIEGQVASDPPPPPPAAGAAGETATGEAATTGAATGGAATGGAHAPEVGVQIGAYATREAAQAGWSQMSARLEPLRGRGHRILEGQADSGTVFRLQVVAENVAAARQLCATLRQGGGDCQVKD
jgi:hypothetical protein